MAYGEEEIVGFSLDGENNWDGVGGPSADLARHGNREIDEFEIQFARFGDGPAQFGPTHPSQHQLR